MGLPGIRTTMNTMALFLSRRIKNGRLLGLSLTNYCNGNAITDLPGIRIAMDTTALVMLGGQGTSFQAILTEEDYLFGLET